MKCTIIVFHVYWTFYNHIFRHNSHKLPNSHLPKENEFLPQTLLILISLQPNVVDLWYFILWILKYQRITPSDIEFLAKTLFLWERISNLNKCFQDSKVLHDSLTFEELFSNTVITSIFIFIASIGQGSFSQVTMIYLCMQHTFRVCTM